MRALYRVVSFLFENQRTCISNRYVLLPLPRSRICWKKTFEKIAKDSERKTFALVISDDGRKKRDDKPLRGEQG
jgi:hypothetical protein